MRGRHFGGRYGLNLLEKNQVDDALRVFIKAAADLRLPVQTSTVIGWREPPVGEG